MQHISLLVVLNSPWEDDSFSGCEKRQVVGHLGFYASQGLGVPYSVSFVPIDRCTNFKERTFLSNFCRHINFPNCQSSWLAFSANGCMMAVYRRSLSLCFLCELYRSSFTPVPWGNSLNACCRDRPPNSLVSPHPFQSFLSTPWCYVLNWCVIWLVWPEGGIHCPWRVLFWWEVLNMSLGRGDTNNLTEFRRKDSR